MVEKQPGTSAPKGSRKTTPGQDKISGKASDGLTRHDAVDRPGFDLGGATGKMTAGTGLGLGTDAAESRRARRLPGRRGKPM
ncbi:hypothetical protein [Stappia sp. ICDLI1TA098]